MIGNVLLGFLLLLALLVVGLLISGQVARHNLVRRFPPPGRMLQLNGYRLHVRCEGQGPINVFLEAGLNDFSLHWNRLQPLLAQHARTCSYDRAGLGWSDASPNPPTLTNAVEDLHAVVHASSGQAPLILVGHSFGSLLVRSYAQRYPEKVRALVLLDPANEFMADRIPGYGEALAAAARQFRKLARLVSLGLVALASKRIPADRLSGEALAQYRAVVAVGSFCRAAAAATTEMLSNLKAMQEVPETALAKFPVIVISRGQTEGIPGLPEDSAQALERTWASLQADLVQRLNATQVTATRSGHSIQLSEPELVYRTIKSLIDRESSAGGPAGADYV